ncbi:anthranilate synthase component I [Bacillus thuringiensis]|uniref:anthranilate synthase component I n=1 Tax=Bacillus thuringiensis TaxID=1428 RepID=UPI000BFB76A2|nr:anthranilate synthase component I [Bacillus thuringiensis]MDA1764285.1 anthranilate synthase component I [Bacillus cereus]PGO45473.1 anthranilate synthase component I [Bacillus thuringiensis]
MKILSNLKPTDSEMYYSTSHGLQIQRIQKSINDTSPKIEELLNNLNNQKGAFFSSDFEYTGRYSRWNIGFINPPIEVCSKGTTFTIQALNKRGKVLLQYINENLSNQFFCTIRSYEPYKLIGEIIEKENDIIYEDKRTKQSSIFNLLRYLKEIFYSNDDEFLGLYGAFGYALIFQFEKFQLNATKSNDKYDLQLYIPDEFLIVDHKVSRTYLLSYDFKYKEKTTNDLLRDGTTINYNPHSKEEIPVYQKGYYSNLVRKASISFKRGDLFEVVPTQSIYKKCNKIPSELFKKLCELNPSPYSFIINLGSEFLIGSSPEMYVRVEEKNVETCPISGTIKRGNTIIEDAENIKSLLNSSKDESELTMCTDVDRNDKSRVCVPGSVQVIGRRQIETYSHLFHTVDHIKGVLDQGYDALDAFITHMWAVTVTGAPKLEAIKWIDNHELSSRGWYGGAIGWFSFSGNLNTGLTLRTMTLKKGIAEIRVGATLLYDSVPEEEEEETLIKSMALIKAIESNDENNRKRNYTPTRNGVNKKVLLVDHEDSFVHTLSNYFKQTGVSTIICRPDYARNLLEKDNSFDLVILSPGPGNPKRFNLQQTIKLCIQKQIPILGICLGFQGIIEYYNGKLELLEIPEHGKKSHVYLLEKSPLFDNIPNSFPVGLYHSIYAKSVPDDLKITAKSKKGIVMAVEHISLPIFGIQFHPESIMTSYNDIGLKIINNIVSHVYNYSKK